MCAGPAEVEFLDAHYLRRLLTLQSVDDLVRETFGLQSFVGVFSSHLERRFSIAKETPNQTGGAGFPLPSAAHAPRVAGEDSFRGRKANTILTPNQIKCLASPGGEPGRDTGARAGARLDLRQRPGSKKEHARRGGLVLLSSFLVLTFELM